MWPDWAKLSETARVYFERIARALERIADELETANKARKENGPRNGDS